MPTDLNKGNWVAVDWGTSNVRLWLLDAGGDVLASRNSHKGMASLAPVEFEPALLELLEGVLPAAGRVTIVACGMVGASQGWHEAPYSAAPCRPPSAKAAVCAPAADQRLDVRILPGVMQIAPADVMRGEETQIAGYLAGDPSFCGTLCLPGTHTKWVDIADGCIRRFQTCMTGELFALLANQSVLRHSVHASDIELSAFDAAVSKSLDGKVGLAGELFGIRAQSVLPVTASAGDGKCARGRLSGLLIGSELAATRGYWQTRATRIVGDGALAELYRRALAAAGGKASTMDASALTLCGLNAAYRELVA